MIGRAWRWLRRWPLGAGPRRAAAEALAAAAALALLLAPLLAGDPPAAQRAGLLLLLSLAAAYAALRLRLPEGGLLRRARREAEALFALGAALGLAAGLANAALRSLGGSLMWGTLYAAAETALCLAGAGVLRAGAWVWVSWARLRRSSVQWNLVHYQLALILIAGLLPTTLLLSIPMAQLLSLGDPDASPAAKAVAGLLAILSSGAASLLLVGPGLLLVFPPALLIAYLFARRVTRRLERLAAAAASLRAGAYGARIAVDGEDEIARLQTDFNAMAATLEQAMRELQRERDAVAGLLQQRRQLIASVSHELRTPVATMRGHLESAAARGGGPPETWGADVAVMEREAVRLQRLIDDLVTLSRAEAGGLTLALAPTDVGASVRAAAASVAPLAWAQGRVEVVADAPEGLPLAVADPGRLDQILLNLLRNGVRHTPPGGIVAASAAAEPGWVTVAVRDTGEGIAPEDMPHIFERFYRGDRARERDAGGSGLGLALVRELAESMGGRVAAESAPGEGSCFTVRLPVAAPRDGRSADDADYTD